MLCAGVGIEPEPPVLWADRTSTEVPHHPILVDLILLEKALPVPERI